MKRLGKIILLLVFFLPVAAKSQQTTQPDSLLNKLTGNWVLKGTIAGQETIHDIAAKRVLNKQYIQLTEVSREKDGKGNPAYEAVVYFCWQEPKKQYFCLWLDNTSNEGISNQVVGQAKQNGDKIELVFTYKDATKFYTTFLYDRNTDSWQWNMDGEEKGKLQPFARVKLTRN
ncbi:MAG: hypothetical protein ABUT20_17660 [Bacteroidota bacterium]